MTESKEKVSLLTDLAAALHSGNIPSDVIEERTLAAASAMGASRASSTFRIHSFRNR